METKDDPAAANAEHPMKAQGWMSDETSLRLLVLSASLLGGCVALAAAGALIDGPAADFLFDKRSSFFRYPFTIQNLMWLIFAGGIGEISVRLYSASRETMQMRRRLLPEEEEAMLRAQDLGRYYKRIRLDAADRTRFLQRLITRTILQFQSSRSVGQANALLNSSLELFQHEVDLRYSMLRYVVWLIPTLGFIGTVIGIALALSDAGLQFSQGIDLENSGKMLVSMTQSLGIAFYTTLLALILSAILVFGLHIAQAREERALNHAGQYCLDNLINRLYEK